MESSPQFTSLVNAIKTNISEPELRKLAELAVKAKALFDYAPTKGQVFLKETATSSWSPVPWNP